ncbi:Mitotic spindle-associated MMXD complex subunit MIP18 [Verticillium nonalfalfae]|uniref:Mitotic spindle-associated MMXD complex subunit MIP18 n=1 Tax=Verticillium nonalfalfae TaxID=1051616 RepID=A0A3M9XWL0_9PEZI|nr:Mitotic spindle-associated MMXD complex subunit MIP18 [Verticillium nonalfalfae]RNJ52026.1 Mitotic spindle-associated MMXD complex subunit MIP18 [Verticillium nonalfalfae]
MDRDVDNANPTILTAAQLPTRQSKKNLARKGPDNKYDGIILAKPDFLSHPFCDADDFLWHDKDDANEDFTQEPIDEQEIYDLISTISDPEHPLSLGQLAVVNLPDIYITPAPTAQQDPDALITVLVEVTPTITHCSLATVIGLGIRFRLEQALPPNYRIDVRIKENTHSQDEQVNKQLGDKERVAAAVENDTLKGVLDKMLETCV